MFWWILRKFSDVPMPAGQTMLRVLDRKIVDELKNMRERARFVHGMMAWVGYDVASVEVEHAPRTKGKSKYNVARMFKLAFHAVTSFSIVPLRLATWCGFTGALITAGIGMFYLWRKLAQQIAVPGFAATILAVLFVGSVQMLMLGILGEYIGRTYQEVQNRPLYVVREIL
jgi:dolichol-phosphate mannosyltransferase